MRASNAKKLKPTEYYGFKLDKKGRFNGKDLGYWHAKADELVMQCLVSAMNVDTRSLPGMLAHEQLRSLAMGVNPLLFEKVIMDIKIWKENFAVALSSMLAVPGSLYCAKHQPKATKRKRRKKVAKENRVDPLD